MAIKGIKPFEQHVEKIVVGVAAAAFLGVLTLQFVGHPNSVKIGMGKDEHVVPIDQAFDVVAEKAKVVQGKITSVDPASIKPPEAKGVLEDFRAKQKGAIAPHPKLAAALDKPRSIIGGSLSDNKPGEIQNKRFAAVTVAAPATPMAAAYIATIHPLEMQQAPELAKLLPPAPQPPDKASVSVESTFNGKELADHLASDPDGDGPASALPSHWWTGTVQILGVGLERQELKPDGTWTDPAPVAPMPGRLDLKSELEKSLAAGGSIKTVLDEAARSAQIIRRPQYYSIIFGEEWLPPRDSASQNAVGGTADEKARLLVKRDSLNRELQTKQSQRERFSGGEKPPPAPKNPGGGPGSGGKGGGPPKPEPPVADHKNDEKSRQLKQLDSQIEKLFEERSRVDARLAELGEKLPDAPAGAPAKAAPVAVEPALLENDAIRIWSHDVTVERGKTYRYRIHVFVNNPIYGHGTALLPDQADLAKPVALRSAESEWSEPVKVDDQSYFFITSAQEQDPVTKGPKAAAEVYVFSWGFWRKGSVNLEPGDSLTAEVKLPDFEKALAAAAKPKPDPNQPDAPVPPAPPGEGGGGKNVRPAPGAPQPPEAPVDPDAPKTAEPVIFKQVKVENDALLLDVATTAAIGEEGFKSQKTEQQAYLRDSSGRIITRVPDQERQKRIYQRIARSATLGEEATQPKTAIIEPIRPIKPPTDPKKDKDKPAPSTGGG